MTTELNLYTLKNENKDFYKETLKELIGKNNWVLKQLNNKEELTNVSVELLKTESIIKFTLNGKKVEKKIKLSDYLNIEVILANLLIDLNIIALKEFYTKTETKLESYRELAEQEEYRDNVLLLQLIKTMTDILKFLDTKEQAA